MARQASLRRARSQRSGETAGFIVTWDVDSKDRVQCARVRRFIFGDRTNYRDRTYAYSRFVQREGVRYLGQSVLFVTQELLPPLCAFLQSNGVGLVVTEARLGRIIRV